MRSHRSRSAIAGAISHANGALVVVVALPLCAAALGGVALDAMRSSARAQGETADPRPEDRPPSATPGEEERLEEVPPGEVPATEEEEVRPREGVLTDDEAEAIEQRAEERGEDPPGEGAAEEQRGEGDASSAQEEEAPAEGPPDIPHREVPDYDGRPEPGIDAGDALLWIPRVIFYPVHALFEYILRRPLGYIATTGEREHWGIFEFGRSDVRRSWAIVPTLFVDFGFQPSGGAYVWFDNVIATGNDLRFQIGFGGIDWLRAAVLDRIHLGEDADIEAQFTASMRPDYTFLGFGPEDPQLAHLSRFGWRFLAGEIAANLRPWRASHLRVVANVSANEFYDTDFRQGAQELTISDAVAQPDWYPSLGGQLPPGFGGYTAYTQRVEGSVDTRQARPIDGSGVRIEAHAELGVDLHRPLERRWLRWGGGAGAYWDIDSGRTLGIWAVADFASALGSDPVTFTELPDFGARGRMAGFRRGWITGPSAIAASIEYRYPIWIAIDGFLNVTAGNAFGPELDGFAPEKLRMSFMLGMRSVGDPDQSFTLQVGFGTDTFENGLAPAVVRISAGTQEGF
jgi:hypothetical protein